MSESFATSRARSFVNDLSGRVLRRVDNAGSAHFTYVDGNPLASTNAAGNFDNDYNYTPVNERYPGACPGSCVVSSGDTLRAIGVAQREAVTGFDA
ncbi:MAG: hypothetical protein ING90_14465 [Rhodocyclaceae bacterium]|nr:hypothetical protein [Rhodocyclaceae bacterium]MCA3074803.1 hypothetical protein [Rhodocyclaceae bacterium]MCA3090870.1 hypothetical protein [Rhodocyclaceae bacterium]MCA3095451.1 hypothetical protein [Rhodocyclaceae bacterium]MCA3099708.1 hypothetical protein [Rhodocyclaceae bacterium]